MFEKDLRFLAGAKTIKSLPDILFSQLIDAGFNIEYKLTKLIKEKNVICLISK